jgi:hypothetical protein
MKKSLSRLTLAASLVFSAGTLGCSKENKTEAPTPDQQAITAPQTAQGSAVTVSGTGGGPYIDYKYPQNMNLLGGPGEKRIDCGRSYNFAADPKKLFATYAFLKEVDNNGQALGADTMPAGDDARKAEFSTALLIYLRHFGRDHHICLKQAGSTEVKIKTSEKMTQGKTRADAEAEAKAEVDAIYGAGWENQAACPLVDITDKCERSLGIK